MKKLLFLLAVCYTVSCHCQITNLKGSNKFCPDEPIEFWAYGDTITHWAYADEPDSIISTDWHFIDYPESARDYLLYSSVDTTLIDIWGPGGFCFCSVYIPNIFTPDGDDFNEIFKPVVNCDEHVSSRLTIFSREQLMIFDQNGIDVSWDGRHPKEGHVLDNGTYTYIFSILTEDGVTTTREGFVILGS